MHVPVARGASFRNVRPRLPWAVLLLAAGCVAPGPRAEPRFVFQNCFWVNLHHFLRAEARRQARGEALELDPEALSAAERAAWNAGLEAYGDLASRNLLFDDELVALTVALAGAGNARSLPRGMAGERAEALEQAAPVYRAHSWPEQRRRNQEWIAEVEPLVARHAEELTAALAAAYRVDWPALPILIDPCSESGPFLAYTTSLAPPGYAGHVVIAPSDSNRGPVAFECIAHEASHVVDATLTGWIDAESARQGIAPPAELWHALLFLTSGFVAERILGAAGTYRADVTSGHGAFADALERHWRPYLEGRVPFDPALSGLVRAAALALGGPSNR